MHEAVIYIGTPEALRAEIGLDACYSGARILAAFESNGAQLTPECLDDWPDAALIAEYETYLGRDGAPVRIAYI